GDWTPLELILAGTRALALESRFRSHFGLGDTPLTILCRRLGSHGGADSSAMRSTPSSLLWQRLYERRRPPAPVRQLVVVLEAIRLDHDPTFHWFAGDIELPDIWFGKYIIEFVVTKTNDHRVLPNTDQHVSI